MAEFSKLLTHPLSFTFASEAIISNCKSTTAKKILITGASGYVGQHLIASLAFGGVSIIGGGTDNKQQYKLYCTYNSLSTFEADLNDLLQSTTLHPSIEGVYPIPNVDFSQSNYIDTIQQAVCGTEGEEQTKLDAIIHLAALSSPGYCEKNQDEAMKVNLPLDLIKFGAPIIYMSTDQVYEGTKQYYKEDIDETNPVNVYGKSKLEYEKLMLGENGIPGSTILRSSLILGVHRLHSNAAARRVHTPHSYNSLKVDYKLQHQQITLSMNSDQWYILMMYIELLNTFYNMH